MALITDAFLKLIKNPAFQIPTEKYYTNAITVPNLGKSDMPLTSYNPTDYDDIDLPNKTIKSIDELPEITSGGQGTRKILTSSLAEARRKARLAGRDLTTEEVKGVTEGYFSSAGERLAAAKSLALAEREQDIATRGQDIAMRGQDLSAFLTIEGLKQSDKQFFTGLISEERRAKESIASAERMHRLGLITSAQLEAKRLDAEERMNAARIEAQNYAAELGYMGVKEQTEHSGGLFGGGGFLGLGIEM